MVYKKSLLVFFLIICVLFGVSFVSASDANDTVMTSEDTSQVMEEMNVEEAVTSADDVNDSEMLESYDGEDVLSDEAGTFTDLQKIIDDGEMLESSDDKDAVGVGAGTFTDLQKMIKDAESGSTITLQKDYTYDENFTTYGIKINKELTINGNGYKLNALSKSRIFDLDSSGDKGFTIKLNNIVFCNGFSDNGGAIYARASSISGDPIIINNCEFVGNKATDSGGAIACDQGKYLELSGCNFRNNYASEYGGAISIDCTALYCTNCNFIKNSAKNGGAISLTYGPFARITKCAFTSNYATEDGGAIWYGGNIFEDDGVNVNSCTFSSNTCKNRGGAIFMDLLEISVTNSKFNKNHASSGGAIYDGDGVIIRTSTFTGNIATKGAGAVYGGKYESFSGEKYSTKLVKCTFEDNKAPKCRDTYSATLSNCVFNYLKLTLNTVNVKKSASSFFLTATLKKGSTPIKGKVVAFKFNGKTYKVKTNSKGIAKVTISKAVINKLVVGKTISYQAYSSKLTVKKTAKVKK